MQRTNGILLHPTSLPGRFKIGDFGEEAHHFVDFLANAGQGVWQVLPLGPPGYGHSPYNALSAFAGNPALIDLQQLVDDGDLDQTELDAALAEADKADFHQTHLLKQRLLLQAGRRFLKRPLTRRHTEFTVFCQEESSWLDDFALFMALRTAFDDQTWQAWPAELRTRQPETINAWREKLMLECQLYRYQQFIFARQWQSLKEHANRNGIRIFGDIPIFVAFDSADVWANQHLFQVDDQGHATAVAGVPPDYFSKTGQRWGNPLYRWDRLEAENFTWWLKRFDTQLKLSDLVRIDHFRGFQACWSIPTQEKTAINGHWEAVPGRRLFETLSDTRGDLPIIAEDLGVITPDVEKLRDDFGFPGMKILQFAFDSGPDNPYLPENHVLNSVVYTGTHDNNTTLGWWRSLDSTQKDRIRSYLGQKRPQIPWDLVELAMSSIASLCIIPCQDILGCDSKARFNTPGKATGNWSWQMRHDDLSPQLAEKLLMATRKHRRAQTH